MRITSTFIKYTFKLTKTNFHKILTFVGMDTADKDVQYDQLFKTFSHLTQTVAAFSTNTTRVKDNLHELVVSQFNLAQNISEFYKEKRLQLREVERFKLAYQRVISSYWNTFVSTWLFYKILKLGSREILNLKYLMKVKGKILN